MKHITFKQRVLAGIGAVSLMAGTGGLVFAPLAFAADGEDNPATEETVLTEAPAEEAAPAEEEAPVEEAGPVDETKATETEEASEEPIEGAEAGTETKPSLTANSIEKQGGDSEVTVAEVAPAAQKIVKAEPVVAPKSSPEQPMMRPMRAKINLFGTANVRVDTAVTTVDRPVTWDLHSPNANVTPQGENAYDVEFQATATPTPGNDSNPYTEIHGIVSVGSGTGGTWVISSGTPGMSCGFANQIAWPAGGDIAYFDLGVFKTRPFTCKGNATGSVSIKIKTEILGKQLGSGTAYPTVTPRAQVPVDMTDCKVTTLKSNITAETTATQTDSYTITEDTTVSKDFCLMQAGVELKRVSPEADLDYTAPQGPVNPTPVPSATVNEAAWTAPQDQLVVTATPDPKMCDADGSKVTYTVTPGYVAGNNGSVDGNITVANVGPNDMVTVTVGNSQCEVEARPTPAAGVPSNIFEFSCPTGANAPAGDAVAVSVNGVPVQVTNGNNITSNPTPRAMAYGVQVQGSNEVTPLGQNNSAEIDFPLNGDNGDVVEGPVFELVDGNGQVVATSEQAESITINRDNCPPTPPTPPSPGTPGIPGIPTTPPVGDETEIPDDPTTPETPGGNTPPVAGVTETPNTEVPPVANETDVPQQPKPVDQLARTGVEATAVAPIALLVSFGGVVLLVVARRRNDA